MQFIEHNLIESILLFIVAIFVMRVFKLQKNVSEYQKINMFLLKKMYQQFNEFGIQLKKNGIETAKIKITQTEKDLLEKDLPDDLKKELDKFLV